MCTVSWLYSRLMDFLSRERVLVMQSIWEFLVSYTGRSCALLSLLLFACSAVEVGERDLEHGFEGPSKPGEWASLGRTWRAQRFSPLTDITVDNVSEVGFAWE